jgi:arsenate reductase
MNKIIIYHNTRCSTSRKALEMLYEKGIEPEVVNYLDGHVTEKELKHVLKLLGISVEELVRKKESLYKELYEGKKMNEEKWIKAMVKNPILIERPIVIKGKKAVIGRPVEKVLEIL